MGDGKIWKDDGLDARNTEFIRLLRQRGQRNSAAILKIFIDEALWEIKNRANTNGLGASIQETWRLIRIESLSAEKMQFNQLISHDFKSSFIKLKLRFSEERNKISVISLKSSVGFA